MSITRIFPGPLMGITYGILLIIFRKKISIYLEKAYQKFPTNKISEQFYKLSYKVNPIYIAILGIIIIAFGVIGMFQ